MNLNSSITERRTRGRKTRMAGNNGIKSRDKEQMDSAHGQIKVVNQAHTTDEPGREASKVLQLFENF